MMTEQDTQSPSPSAVFSGQCQRFQRPPPAPPECASGAASHAGVCGASLGASSELVAEARLTNEASSLPDYLLPQWPEPHAKVL